MASPNPEPPDDSLAPDSPAFINARSRMRYSIVADLEYSLLKSGRIVRRGRGKTVNLSSTGLLFESDTALPTDRRIMVSVAWPVMLGPGIGLTLHITGRTIRAQDKCTAIRNEKYEFRVRGSRQGGSGHSYGASAKE